MASDRNFSMRYEDRRRDP